MKTPYFHTSKRLRYPLYIFLLCSSLLLHSSAWAAPEDRGAMGGVYALSLGGFIATGTQEEGERLPSQLGSSLRLMLGEEVLPRIFVGIGIDNYYDGSGNPSEPSMTQLYAFGLEGRYRLTGEQMGLVLMGGIGIGAGAFMKEGDSLTSAEASSGGSVWKLGLAYELGGDKASGLKYLPYVLFQRIGPQMENKVEISVVSLGVELLYASGRD